MVCKIIKTVIVSYPEAEIGTCYINTSDLIPICVCEEEMGHPQGPTPVQVYNTMVVGFANKNIKQKNVKINRHEILLAPRQKGSRTIQNLLEPR